MEEWKRSKEEQVHVEPAEKKEYVAPTVHVTFFEFEDTIAAASAQIVAGDEQNATPEVEDWKVDKQEDFWDF